MSKSGNLAALSALFNPNETTSIYYAEDPPYLPRILVFYWPVQAVGSLSSTSRIRVTILSAAGFKNFAAFSVAPNSSFYAAVHKLPEEKQRDDVCRGIAFALSRYFSEVSTEVKNAITDENLEHGIGLKWGQTHAAQVAARMSRVLNVEEILEALRPFVKERTTITMAAPAPQMRPLASIRKTRPSYLPSEPNGHTPSKIPHYATPSKRIPSSSKQRTPSVTMVKKASPSPTKQSVEQLETLRFKMCEVVDTEDRYITRLQELIDLVTDQGRTAKSLSSKVSGSKSQRAVSAMLQFPSLLDQIKDLNLAFLDDVESVIQTTETSTLEFLDQTAPQQQNGPSLTRDPLGIYAFAKVLLNHFPKFPVPYRSYLDLHSQVSSNLDQFLKEGSSSVQIAPSLLMEPAQRISRYGLYIDTMLPHIPQNYSTAIRTLEKARKIIAEICEMEPAASTILDSLRIDYESRKRTLSPTKLISGLTRGTGTIREAPALTGSVKDRDASRLLPSLSRSFSRKKASRPGLGGILSEQDPAQANNIQTNYVEQKSDENKRPWSSGTNGFSLRSRNRPPTAGSMSSSSNSRPGTRSGNEVLESSILNDTTNANINAELQTKLNRLEEENYRLLAENAELKRQMRECRCGGITKR